MKRILKRYGTTAPNFSTHRVLYPLCCGLTIIVILLVGLIKHPAVVAAEIPDAPIRCQISTYVMTLNDFNFTEDSFYIDTWLNANCNKPGAPEMKSLDFPTAKKYQLLNTETAKVGEGIYSYTNLEGTFHQDWSLKNYPFDRHKLKLFFETSQNIDVSGLVYEADKKHSGIHPDINLEDGWEITKFSLESGITHYKTNFADPRATTDEFSFSKLMIAFDIQRTSYLSFLKLTAGVYIAFAICVLCVFFDVSENELFSASLSILVGCLFAVFVNLQAAGSVLGAREELTLVDEIHIATMLFILVVSVVQTVFYMLYKDEKKRNLQRIELLSFGVLLASYVLINTILIVSARLSG